MMKRTILIVDDERVNRRILGKMLQDDYNILEAEDGAQALELLRANTELISTVLLDIVMPVMDGYELLRIMREDPALSKIPVIVSSQKGGDAAEIRALSLGAQDFIAKPYKAEILRHRLKGLIQFRETASLINKVERDELTGLYNKQFFLENVSDWLRQHPEQQFDLMCIGIERFRLINESFGTDKGDQLLRHIARLLQTAQRPIFAARFTADLFFLFVQHREQYSNELLKHWYDKVNEFPINMDIKLHCGIYAIDDAEIPVSLMCDRVQLASEKNKGVYDACFFLYDDSLRQKLLDEQFIISNMQTALKEGQYQVYYQPKYDLTNELIAGAEALVRWLHPQRGISPVAVSINVSRADIYNPELSRILLSLLEKYAIPIRYLHLEITESAYTDNPEQIIVGVDKLRKLGFVVEMDDFGSGYSSLNMLAEMPVDVLKLDMRFIQNEAAKSSGRGILSFVISLAKWLDLAVVAEGVETGEQIAMLRSMDCNYVQGFYYARPMPRPDFEALMQTVNTTEMICSSQTVRQRPHREMKPVASGGRQMLIVDDLEFNRAVLAGNFADEFTVVEKENGAQAWAYLDQHHDEVDIVMLDLLMPVMDGFQLLDKIRADRRTKDMPVIITSQGDGESERRALQMRADDFISKPYNPDIIRHRVDNVLANHRLQALRASVAGLRGDGDAATDQALVTAALLKPHFDFVRLVEPEHTRVLDDGGMEGAGHACYSVWGKHTRCRDCISLRALQDKTRYCKLEHAPDGLYVVLSEFVPNGRAGAVLEMVIRLADADARDSQEPDALGQSR